ncbi:hypothetical protein SLOPH_837 [Spraguea lophii 42_110]|uniref:Uncharacterized protein n=1 Tax=Spraguea lophii (strain 42_110) TaxID=1358809 RepID=S7WBX9_SPRLO|nr:hypothetical protein SLOPH_837 [Spraguea lophii 42_110]
MQTNYYALTFLMLSFVNEAFEDDVPPEHKAFSRRLIAEYDKFNQRIRSSTNYFCTQYKLFFELFHIRYLTPIITEYFLSKNHEFDMLVLKNCRLLFYQLDKFEEAKDKQLFSKHFYIVIRHWVRKYPCSVSSALNISIMDVILDKIYYPVVLDALIYMLTMRDENFLRFMYVLDRSKFFERLCCLCLRNRENNDVSRILNNTLTEISDEEFEFDGISDDSDDNTDTDTDSTVMVKGKTKMKRKSELESQMERQTSNSQIYLELNEDSSKYRNRVKNTIKILLLFASYITAPEKKVKDNVSRNILLEAIPLIFDMLLEEKYYFYTKRLFRSIITLINKSDSAKLKLSDKLFERISDDSIIIYYTEEDNQRSRKKYEQYKIDLRKEKAIEKENRKERYKNFREERDKLMKLRKSRIGDPVFKSYSQILKENTSPDFQTLYEDYFTPLEKIPQESLTELDTPKSKFILYIIMTTLTYSTNLLNMIFTNNYYKFLINIFFLSDDYFIVNASYNFIAHILVYIQDYSYLIKILENTPFIPNLLSECKTMFSYKNNSTPSYRLNHSFILQLFLGLSCTRKYIKNTVKTKKEVENYDLYIAHRTKLLNILCVLDTDEWIVIENDFLFKELRREKFKYNDKEIVTFLDDCYTETLCRYISQMILKDIPHSDIFERDSEDK